MTLLLVTPTAQWLVYDEQKRVTRAKLLYGPRFDGSYSAPGKSKMVRFLSS
jgi:hypothetical protein